VAGPLLVRLLARPTVYQVVTCPAGTLPVYTRILPGSTIHLVSDSQVSHTHLPDLRISEFFTSLHNFMYPEFIGEFDGIKTPATITSTIGLKNQNEFWLVIDSSLASDSSGVLAICGHWSQGPAKSRGIFYGDTVVDNLKP
jgi:hypothetical protein